MTLWTPFSFPPSFRPLSLPPATIFPSFRSLSFPRATLPPSFFPDSLFPSGQSPSLFPSGHSPSPCPATLLPSTFLPAPPSPPSGHAPFLSPFSHSTSFHPSDHSSSLLPSGQSPSVRPPSRPQLGTLFDRRGSFSVHPGTWTRVLACCCWSATTTSAKAGVSTSLSSLSVPPLNSRKTSSSSCSATWRPEGWRRTCAECWREGHFCSGDRARRRGRRSVMGSLWPLKHRMSTI